MQAPYLLLVINYSYTTSLWIGHIACPAQVGGTPRGIRQKKGNFLKFYPFSFPPSDFWFSIPFIPPCIQMVLKELSQRSRLQYPPHPPTTRYPRQSWSENMICHIPRSEPSRVTSQLLQTNSFFQSINERETVLTFFGTSENDNFTAFSESKRRNQKTSSFYSLKVEFHSTQ